MRYPMRRAASPNAFENVRVTTMFPRCNSETADSANLSSGARYS